MGPCARRLPPFSLRHVGRALGRGGAALLLCCVAHCGEPSLRMESTGPMGRLQAVVPAKELQQAAQAAQEEVADIVGLPFLRPLAVESKSMAEMNADFVRMAVRATRTQDEGAFAAAAWEKRLPVRAPAADKNRLTQDVGEDGKAEPEPGAPPVGDEAWDTLGYYDFGDGNRLVVRADLSPLARQRILRHELTHALQDQHFQLAGRVAVAQAAGQDAFLALQAVAEGQATQVEQGRAANGQALPLPGRDGQALFGLPALRPAGPLAPWPILAGASFSGHLPWPGPARLSPEEHAQLAWLQGVFGGAIDARRAAILRMFPYRAGLAFWHQVSRPRQLANAWANVFARMPTTTREILHPEVWQAGQVPAAAVSHAAVDAFLDGGHAAFFSALQTTFGELSLALLLGGNDAAFAQAAGWRGGSLQLLARDRPAQQPVAYADADTLDGPPPELNLLYVVQWQDDEAAERGLQAWLAATAAEGQRPGPRVVRRGCLTAMVTGDSPQDLYASMEAALEQDLAALAPQCGTIL